jgi:hypothetical protein
MTPAEEKQIRLLVEKKFDNKNAANLIVAFIKIMNNETLPPSRKKHK